jgi:hypothetical protein
MSLKWCCFKITNLDALEMIYNNGPTNAREEWSFVAYFTIGEFYFAKAKLWMSMKMNLGNFGTFKT